MLPNFGIRQKIFALFTIITLLPLVIINIIWLNSSQSQLKQAAANRQSILLSNMAQRVNEFLGTKINTAITYSQDQSVNTLSLNDARLKLLQYSFQDSDVRRISLIDTLGKEKLVIQDGLVVPQNDIAKNDEALKVLSLLGDDASTSDVTHINEQPFIKIYVPLLDVSKLDDQNLTNAQALVRRYGASTNGLLIVDISLNELWKSVLSTKLGTDGYIYLIDSKGGLIAHQDKPFMATKNDVTGVAEVKNAIKTLSAFDLEKVASEYTPAPSVSQSEKNVKVLSSSFPISKTRWSIIGEEPVASVYSASNRISTIALFIFIISAPVSIGLVLLATRSIIIPIRDLTDGAIKMGGGEFDKKLVVKGKDELALMAQTFNKMGENLQNMLGKYRTQNADLTSEHAKLQAVLDTIADGVVVLDTKFKIVLINKTTTQLSPQADPVKIIGHLWTDVFPLKYKGKAFSNQLLDGELLYFHDVILQTTRQLKYLEITSIRLHDDPNGIAYILTIHDITQRRELDNMKLDFVSMAAHELRTPLTALSGYLELVNSGKTSPEKTQEFVRLAGNNAGMLNGLINNLLALSRIERNALKLNMNKLNWVEVLKNEMQNHETSAKAKHITLQSDLTDETAYIWGDEMSLREVVGNLISNSIHYTPEGGSITVSVLASSRGIKTSITDTGIGIKPEAIKKLFAKYYRAEGGLTTNSQGTGIGLYISKTIIEAHGGTIGVNSELGHGSEFYFSLAPYDEKLIRQDEDNGSTIKTPNKVKWF